MPATSRPGPGYRSTTARDSFHRGPERVPRFDLPTSSSSFRAVASAPEENCAFARTSRSSRAEQAVPPDASCRETPWANDRKDQHGGPTSRCETCAFVKRHQRDAAPGKRRAFVEQGFPKFHNRVI